jgi:hypothetical protein
MLQNADEITKKILNSGKVQLLAFANVDDDWRLLESLSKFRFFGKTPDQFIDVVVSKLCISHNPDTCMFYKEKIEVDTASPAIKGFTSLQEALNKAGNSELGVYASLVISTSEVAKHSK